ncbi:hypothetical protein VNO78_28863 [Psophocarpus tetragonolobus]|uniref:Uncharacterized protein n=1 Tax=Psophocarpus tetragonolobus TaxID=3891 RepID=A0AAN9WZG0_PSOTE
MKHLCPILQHTLSLIFFILVFVFFTSLRAEASRAEPRAFQRSHVSLPINCFHMARALSGPSPRGIATYDSFRISESCITIIITVEATINCFGIQIEPRQCISLGILMLFLP